MWLARWLRIYDQKQTVGGKKGKVSVIHTVAAWNSLNALNLSTVGGAQCGFQAQGPRIWAQIEFCLSMTIKKQEGRVFEDICGLSTCINRVVSAGPQKAHCRILPCQAAQPAKFLELHHAPKSQTSWFSFRHCRSFGKNKAQQPQRFCSCCHAKPSHKAFTSKLLAEIYWAAFRRSCKTETQWNGLISAVLFAEREDENLLQWRRELLLICWSRIALGKLPDPLLCHTVTVAQL